MLSYEGAVADMMGTLPSSPIHTKECQVLRSDRCLRNNKAYRETSKGQGPRPLSSMETQINLGQQGRGSSPGHRHLGDPSLKFPEDRGSQVAGKAPMRLN